MSADACDACLARAWLLTRLSGHLDLQRRRIWDLLALTDAEMISALAGRQRAQIESEHAGFGTRNAALARVQATVAGLEPICACSCLYPEQLRRLPAPPAVLYVAGGIMRFVRLCAHDPVAVVGARKADGYGTGVAWSLGRGLGAAGLTVVSGMAAGIDAAAHGGTLDGRGPTVAVLPGPADRAYPRSNANLHRQILRAGAAVSEIAPGTAVRSWMYAARNRVIAAISQLTVVVQARTGSGSLLTAKAGSAAGRPVGAVPGPVTNPLCAGTNQLLVDGAAMIRDVQDALDLLYGAGTRAAPADTRPGPTREQALLLAAIGAGADTVGALVAAGAAADRCLPQVAGLELAGHIRRGPGGRLIVIP